MGQFYLEFIKNNTLISALLIVLIAVITIFIKLRESRIEEKIKQERELNETKFSKIEETINELRKTVERDAHEKTFLLNGLLSTVYSIHEFYESNKDDMKKIYFLKGKIEGEKKKVKK